jgi:hypothetical protein
LLAISPDKHISTATNKRITGDVESRNCYAVPKQWQKLKVRGSIFVPILCIFFINHPPPPFGTLNASCPLCGLCLYLHYSRVLCKLQRGLTAVNAWCERCNIQINEEKTQVIVFSWRFRFPEGALELNGRDIPFVNNVTYLRVAFDKGWGGGCHGDAISKGL